MSIEAIPSPPSLPSPELADPKRLSQTFDSTFPITSYACKKGYITQSYCTPSFETN